MHHKGIRGNMLKTLLCLSLIFFPASTALGRDASDPSAAVPPSRYSPVISGTKSYRPVAPLPWGDVNRRVMPKDAQPPGAGTVAPKERSGKPHGQH